MHSPPTDSSGGPNDLVVEIIETLGDMWARRRRPISTITWMSMRSNSWFPHPMGTSPSSLPSKEFRSRSHWTVSTSSSRTSPSASTNNDVRCGDRECSRKPSTARRPATARDCVSLALVRFAHENAAARLSCLRCLRGRGTAEAASPFLESTRTVDSPSSDVVGWTGVYVPARPARRCRPPRRSQLHLFSTWCRKRYLLITMAGQISSFD